MGAPSSLTGRRWVTVFDHDFTADATQTISPDGYYSIGGFQWKKENSANDSVAMVVTNGVGLVVQPVANTNYNVTGAIRTLPLIWLPLFGIPGLEQLEWGMSLRMWTHVAASNAAANFDDAVTAIDTDTQFALGYQADRGIGTAGTQGFTVQDYVNQTATTNGGGTGFQSSNTIAPGGTNNVVVHEIWRLGSVFSEVKYGGFGLAAGKTWPDPSNLVMALQSLSSQTASFATYTAPGAVPYNIQANQLGLVLGAKRQGSATALSVTFGHVRLDVGL